MTNKTRSFGSSAATRGVCSALGGRGIRRTLAVASCGGGALRILAIAFCGWVTLLLGACTNEVTDEILSGGDGATPITFQTPATRAVVDDANPMKAFSVWGWYGYGAPSTTTPGDPAATTPVNVFDARTVTNTNGTWTYDGDLEFWQSGETYRFYALYPTAATLTEAGCTAASYDSDGTLTLTGFDATKGHDLMMATAEASGDEKPLVALTFQHLLSRVNIRVVGEGGDVIVSRATLTGIKTKGDYSSQSSNPWTLDASVSHTFEATQVSATSIPVSLFGDLLLPPQEVVAEGFQLTVSYRFAGTDEQEDRRGTATLPTLEASRWEAGQSYTYTLTLANNYISFSKPEVNDWSEGSGGIIIVD